MKLSRIKKVCMDAKVIRLYNVGATGNGVWQWLGTDKALFAVEGGTLTMDMLKMIWEISPEKEEKFDLVEDTLEGAVERKLLKPDDIVFLSVTPAMIDIENAPKLTMAQMLDDRVIACDEDQVLFAREALFAPCYGKWDTAMEVLRYDDGLPAWVALYADEVLSGMVRPADKRETTWLWNLAKQIAERAPISGEKENA